MTVFCPPGAALKWARGEADPAKPDFVYILPGCSPPPLPPLGDADVGVSVIYGRANACKVEMLQNFLRSRNLPISGSDGSGASGGFTKKDLAQVVELMCAQDRQFGIMHVRDPANKISAGHAALKAGMPASSLPQFDEKLTPPPLTDATWCSTLRGVSENGPLISELNIYSWARAEKMMYALNSREMKGESFKRGEYRCLNNPDPQFQCTLPMQDYAGRTVVWLHEKVPRSTTTAGPRRVCYVCVEVDTSQKLYPAGSDRTTPPVVMRVLRATCDCTKGQAGCAHKSCTLHTLYNIPRDERLQWRLPSTSKECNWNRPKVSARDAGSVGSSAARAMYSEHEPMEYMDGFKDDDTRPKSERRLHGHHGVKGLTRADFQPRPEHIKESIKFLRGSNNLHARQRTDGA